jgi:chloramphenicol 3-O phosphotransferase
MAAAGAHIIVDEVFLGGARSQERWRKALAGLEVVWVGVRCDVEEANRRELDRSDRTMGMAATQARMVHVGVTYDIEVDTTHASSGDCAMEIARFI